MKKNIVLFGFMGTGKTTVGRITAEDTGRRFVEMDTVIEERESMSINAIFAGRGEAYFRRVEREVAAELSAGSGQVISTGGGVVLDPANIENLGKNGILICLDASSAKIYERIKGDTKRPLLNVPNPEERIKELMDARKPYYDKIKIHIDTTGLSAAGAASEVKRIIADEKD